MTPETAEMRPPRNGPTLRQTSPESRSGRTGFAAMEMAAAAAVSAKVSLVFIAMLDGLKTPD
jgi:hypothetical protein